MLNKTKLFYLGRTSEERRTALMVFFVGVFSATQIRIGGYAAISEFILVALLPYNIIRNFGIFCRDRVAGVLWFLLLWIAFVFVSDIVNDNFFFAFTIRGLIPPLSLLSSILFIYPAIKRNPESLKWYLLGAIISSVISIFIFQKGSDVGREEVLSGQMSAVEAVIGYKLFWVSKVNQLLSLPISCWYQRMPLSLTVVMVSVISVFSLTTGGRSAFAVTFLSVVILLVGGRQKRQMKFIRRNIVFLAMGMVVFVQVAKFGYKEAATHGWMGEMEKIKYEEQMKDGQAGILDALKSGRAEFFVGLTAAIEKPILGHGSFAMDTKGYYIDYIAKYGTPEDLRIARKLSEIGLIGRIPAHSHLMQFWVWAGVGGLVFWVYAITLLVSTLARRMHTVPMFFGYLALVIPSKLWHIMFSPFGGRIDMGVLISVCLFILYLSKNDVIARTKYGAYYE